MASPFDPKFYALLQHCLRPDGTLVPHKEMEFFEIDGEYAIGDVEVSVTWHEVMNHLENHGAREFAGQMGDDSSPFDNEPLFDNLFFLNSPSDNFFRGLQSLGVGADTVDCDGKTALHHAVINGLASLENDQRHRCYHVDKALARLLEKGADPNVADGEGQTPLQLAASLNLLVAIRVLRQGGATFIDAAGELAAAPAEEPAASADAVRIFLALGGDLEAPLGGVMSLPSKQELSSARVGDGKEAMARHDSITAWLDAAALGDVPLLQALREAGADIEACRIMQVGSHTAIGVAATFERVEALRQLCAWQVPLCGSGDDALRPLAACLGHYDRELFLLERWADKSNNEDWKPDSAPKTELAECVELLLERGERPDEEEIVIACQNLRLLEVLWPHAPRLSADSVSRALDELSSQALTPHSLETRAIYARALTEQDADTRDVGRQRLDSAIKYRHSEAIALLRAAGVSENEEAS